MEKLKFLIFPRPSFQPGTTSSAHSSRRSSIMGGRRQIQENRPLCEASYHRHCTEKLITVIGSFY